MKKNRKRSPLICMLMLSGMLAACSREAGQKADLTQKADLEQEAEKEFEESQEANETVNHSQETVIYISGTENGTDRVTSESAATLPYALPSEQDKNAESSAVSAQKPGAISEQTFETELSEYSGKILFTPFAPLGREDEFRMEITQNGKLLTSIGGYVPEWLEEKTFDRLDAVAFYDVNFDGNTDIVLIETYGGVSFAAVYYGFVDREDPDNERYFLPQSQLSEALTSQVQDLSIPGIRTWITGGKKNGEFSNYQEAYEAVGRLSQLESKNSRTFDLIYFNNDDVPELVEDLEGYNLSLYTYANGRVYNLVDHWGYGAMGNAGYEYSPRKNSFRNSNTDYAGAIVYTTYMTMNNQYALDTVVQMVSYNFDDVNGNGRLDEEETGSVGMYGVNYIDGVEVSQEECAAYALGEYIFMNGTMSFEELKQRLYR